MTDVRWALWVVGACVLAGCAAPPGGGGGGGGGAPCGVLAGAAFRVSAYDGLVFPYKPETEAPWDWDGDVPDWMLDVVGALSGILASPELRAAKEILDLVDTYGPLLLEGTVPPDPFLGVYAVLEDATMTPTTTFFGGTTWTPTYGTYTFAELPSRDDSYEPVFDRAVEVDLYPGELLVLLAYDEDLAFDDPIGGFTLALGDLRRAAGCGPVRMRGGPGNGLYSLWVEVEAL